MFGSPCLTRQALNGEVEHMGCHWPDPAEAKSMVLKSRQAGHEHLIILAAVAAEQYLCSDMAIGGSYKHVAGFSEDATFIVREASRVATCV